MNKFLTFVLNKPKQSLALGFFIVAIFSLGLTRLYEDFGYRSWFLEDDPKLKLFDEFERKFGSDELSYVAVYHPQGIFNPNSIELIKELTYDFWRAKDVIRVDSLSNYNWVHSQGDEILVEPFFPDNLELTQNIIDQRKNVALNHPSVLNYLINAKADTSLLYVNLKPTIGESPDYQTIVTEFRKIISKYNGRDGHEIYIAGNPSLNLAFREAAYQDMVNLMPFVLLLTIGLLIVLFKRLSGFILPLFIIALSTGMTIGFSGWVGIPLHSLTSIVPEFMVAIGVAVAIHILSTFFLFYNKGLEKKEALKTTLNKIFFPTLLTSISTAIGFFSFATATIPTIGQLGILTGLGALLCWLTSYLILVPLILILPLKAKIKDKNLEAAKRLEPSAKALKWAHWVDRNKFIIIAIFLTISTFGFTQAMRMEVNSDPFAYFAESYPLTIATHFIEDKMGSAMAVEMIVDSHKDEGAKDPEFLNKVDSFLKWVDNKKYVTKTTSIVEIIKDLNKTLQGDETKFYVIPKSKELIAQQLFLYTMNLPQGMDINNRITVKNDSLRITAMWNVHNSEETLKIIDEFEEQARFLGLHLRVTGKFPLYQSINKSVVHSFLTSITIALIFISILMIAGLKSLRLGLLSLIPNATPLFIGAGIAKLSGQPLDIGTVIVGSVCLGIAVDDTIHFLANLSRFSDEGDDAVRATAKVYTYTLPALTTTTIVLVSSFATFALAAFVPNRNFGIYVAIILAIALIADILFLPALMMALDKKGKGTKEKGTDTL